MLGETCLITRTFDGSDGMSFDVMVTVVFLRKGSQLGLWTFPD